MFGKIVSVFLLVWHVSLGSDSKWYYKCKEGYCLKTPITTNISNPLSYGECNVLCLDSAGVWPKPTGFISVANLTQINLKRFTFSTQLNTPIANLVKRAAQNFRRELLELIPFKSKNDNLSKVHVNIHISDQNTSTLTLSTNESYTVASLELLNDTIKVSLNAQTFFGARNALATLSQLVVYDDLRNRVLFPADFSVTDGPVYNWRGIGLDTSRNYVSPKALKRTLRAMAASKLNTFHWHLTDTASFPYVSKSRPELSQLGAYSPKKVYTDKIIRDIIEYARERGIRVVPELDAPAHVGEGWQESGVLTCFNEQPWSSYCAEPPCGQFDPSRPELYDILEDIYGDMLSQFGTEVFHMGGDEVNIACWNITKSLTDWMVNTKGWNLTKSDFIGKVWAYFQKEAVNRLYKKAGKTFPVILWSSDLTAHDNVADILDPKNYIIQVWTYATDAAIPTLLNKNYSLILSNYDALYLDCGFAGWVTDGNNWCSPYKGWQLAYNNKPVNIAGNRTNQILGGEAVLWTEEAGTSNLDSRLWPRAAAFAEALWTEPSTDWKAAEERMLLHRDRLEKLGVQADEIQPEWCRQNQQNCPIGGKFGV